MALPLAFEAWLLDVVNSVVQLVAIMNPVGAVPIFLELTGAMPEEERRSVVKTVGMVVALLMVIFAVAGKWILEFFNVSVNSLRVAGGIILIAIALDNLRGFPRTRQVDPRDFAVVPLATPLIMGPGTMTTVILLATAVRIDALLVGAMIATGITVAMLQYSELLVKVLKRNGLRVISRFMSLIIAAIAVEMIHSAVVSWYMQLLSGTPA